MSSGKPPLKGLERQVLSEGPEFVPQQAEGTLLEKGILEIEL